MPRANDGGEVLQYLTSITKYTITASGGDTTTAEAATADMADTDVSASTNFTEGDIVAVSGSGGTELLQIATGGIAAGPPVNFTWENPLQLPQDSGARVVEMSAANLNHIAESGIKFGGSLTLTAIKASTSRVAIAYFPSAAEFTFEIPVLGWNNLNLLAAFGAPEAENGAGTAADPYAVYVASGNVATESLTCYRCVGTLHNGDTVTLDICDATIEVNVNATMGGPNAEGFVLQGKATTFVQRIHS